MTKENDVKPDEPPENNANGSEPTEPQVTMTQSQLDKIMGQRARQAKDSAVNELLQSLGVEKPDDLKAALNKMKELEEAQLSEVDKLTRQIEKANATAEAAKAEAAKVIANANEKLLQAAVITTATRQGFNDPADAWQFVNRGEITQDENGSYQGLEDAVKAVLESKPYLGQAEEKPSKGTPVPARQKSQLTQPQVQDPYALNLNF